MHTAASILRTGNHEKNNETTEQKRKESPLLHPIETNSSKKIQHSTHLDLRTEMERSSKSESNEQYLRPVDRHWLKAGEKLGLWLAGKK